MNRIKKFIIPLLIFLFSSLVSYAQNDCIVAFLANDLSSSTAEFKTIVKQSEGFQAWQLLNKEKPALRTNIEELALVSKNLETINIAGGYLKWKALQGVGSWNFSSVIKTNLSKLGVSDDISKYILAPNSKGGAYILQGVSVEAKEVVLADEIFELTNQRSIFPKNNLQAIEGFLEDGTAFTMKELESNFNSFATRINEMSSKIKADPNFQWTNAEGYLKVPFSNFTKTDGTVQAVTKQYVEQQFNAGIGRNAFTIKNDGTVKSIIVFLYDGSNFKLDLTKLKP
jgi:hypothetical protein